MLTLVGGPACFNKIFHRVPLRSFSSSSPNSGHYETLNVPRNASRAAIKANFYKLSKRYHPDVNKEPNAKSKFQAVSEAWNILGDDAKRREYDRQIQLPSSSSSTQRPSDGQSKHYGHGYDETSHSARARHRGATYAWEYRRTSRTRSPPPHPPFGQSRTRQGSAQNPFGGSFRSGTVGDDDMWWPFADASARRTAGRTGSSWRDPFASIHVQRATGHGKPKDNIDDDEHASKTEERQRWTTAAKQTPWTQEDRLKRESVVVRIAQVIGLLFFIVLLSGGFR